mmetsp:Transcript_50136/g.160427  ORF Transcript_50136/g.160427 Transcript_50136/m.160427 type:complete len:137 (-) Transcript_50136:78-488(-)
MGNCGLMPDQHEPLTLERLEEAVRNMDPVEVQRCLDGGLNVHEPVDCQGHTIMDVFVVEHARMLKDTKRFKGAPEEVTRVFCEMQESAVQVLKILRDHGAVISVLREPGLRMSQQRQGAGLMKSSFSTGMSMNMNQ